MKEKIKGIYNLMILKMHLNMMPWLQKSVRLLSTINSFLALAVIVSLIYALGFHVDFDQTVSFPFLTVVFYLFLCEYTFALFRIFPTTHVKRKHKAKPFLFTLYIVVLIISFIILLPLKGFESYVPLLRIFRHPYLLTALVAVEAMMKLATDLTRSLTSRFSPQWIMVTSFLVLIMIGSALLMLPKATHAPIKFIDSLFVTVSAVCVTGLTPLDIPSTFTLTGQIIILVLIQCGGIGIMTFTSFFGLMVAGNHASQNKLLIKDLIDPDNTVSQIFTTLRNIIFITFIIEFLGALCIYYAIGNYTGYGFYVAVFHAISAFCNAGLSIIPHGLDNINLHGNYALLHIISWLIILGGIGFPILFNIWQWFKSKLKIMYRRMSGKYSFSYDAHPHIISSGTVIVLVITTFLIVSGTIVYYITEGSNIFADKTPWGKYSLAFFMSVTPRTAGFNAFPMADLLPVTVMYMIFYMWIGGSPMSTAGGIKTTTFGIAILNVWNTLRGRDHIEFRRRSIASTTVSRAFIIMFASIVAITTSVMLIIAFEPGVSILAVVFECVSAFSTVGLSLDLTASLCMGSKIVLICLMFIGRMGLLTILGCFIGRDDNQFYAYPSEHLSIN